MRRIKVAESKSKQRLLAAAGQLFADHGFDIVSVRDITKLAKANVAAINYHFGSREGLLALVMVRYLGPIITDRLARLDELGRKEVPLERFNHELHESYESRRSLWKWLEPKLMVDARCR